MEAIRKRIRRKGKKITIDLPESFKAEEVDVIILPAGIESPEIMIKEKTSNKMSKEEFQKFLLEAPIMTDEEYQYIQERRKRLDEWR